MKPFGVVSDMHCHLWSVFSTTGDNGLNSRLEIILSEFERAAAEVKAAGGDMLIIGGDIFHKRGTIDPEVLNPLRDSIGRILRSGVSVYAIPGNHDLKSRDTNALSSAVQNINGMSDLGPDMEATRVEVYNEPKIVTYDGYNVAYVPWRENPASLLRDIQSLLSNSAVKPDETYLIIHVGIDGVLPNMPNQGLTDAKLAAFGFRGVFAGHYHNHKALSNNIYSIGSLTHQTWGDIGTRAGFLIVKPDTNEVQYHASHAPSFIDLSEMDEDDMILNCPGNYVRFRGPHMTTDQIDELRKNFTNWGAKGVLIQVPRSTPTMRPAASTTGKIASIDESVTSFIEGRKDIPIGLDPKEIIKRAHSVLNAARIVEAS